MNDFTWSDPSRPSLGTLTWMPAEGPVWEGLIAGDGTAGGFDSLTYELADPGPGRSYKLQIAVAEPANGSPPAAPSDDAAALAERLVRDQTAVLDAALNGFLAETREDIVGHMWWSNPDEFAAMWEEEVGGAPPADAAGLREHFDGPQIVVHDAGPGLEWMAFPADRSRPVAELKFESVVDPEHGVSILLDADARTVLGTGYQSSVTAY